MKTPDKWIRKYLATTLAGLKVGTKDIPISDTRIPANSDHYILMTTIDKSNEQETKCHRVWRAAINIDIVTIYPGNSGSRVLAEDIENEVLSKIASPSIDGFTVESVDIDFAPDLSTITTTQSIYRKIIILNLKLKENG